MILNQGRAGFPDFDIGFDRIENFSAKNFGPGQAAAVCPSRAFPL
jgi:hypothetical protein